MSNSINIIKSSTPYIILVKQFTGANYTIPPYGTKAYSFPKTGSSVVYTFPEPSSSSKYVVNSVVFCSGSYWVLIPNLGSEYKDGYVKCTDINFDCSTYIDPDNQTPSSEIGSNSTVIFNMWYFPSDNIVGVNCPIPLYHQCYYKNGNKINSMQCTLLASISGDYKYEGTYYDPTTYLDIMTDKYWNDGITSWIADMSLAADQSAILSKAKSNLKSKKPFLVGARNSSFDHLVLVVGYRNSGNSLSDYIVLDSCLKEFSDLESFFNSYPNFPKKWGISGNGYVYGEY